MLLRCAARRLAGRLRPHAWPALAGMASGCWPSAPHWPAGSSCPMTWSSSLIRPWAMPIWDTAAARRVPCPATWSSRSQPRSSRLAWVQKLILLAIFVLACAGAAALFAAAWQRVRGAPPLPGLLAAGICYAWNPFVAERLIMGQWAMLLGYAGLPWVLREITAGGSSGPIRPWRLAAAMLPAAVGGFAAMSVTAIAAVPVALCAGASWPERARRLAITAGVIAVASLPWLIPSLVNPVHASPGRVAAFAARADTPFGSLGSLLMLGGIWNAQVVPAGYGGPVSACWLAVVVLAAAGYVAVARPRRICAGAGFAGVLGICVASLGLTAPTRAGLRDAIAFWPGFALLRDGQQFVAPLALTLALSGSAPGSRCCSARR